MCECFMTRRNLLPAIVAGLCLTLSGPTAFAADAPPPNWVWDAATAKQETPASPAFFRRTFRVEGRVIAARVEITGDDQYELFLNGQLVGSGTAWTQIDGYDVSSIIKGGRPQVVAVKAVNGGTAAGIVAKVWVQTNDKSEHLFSTDDKWVSSAKAEPKWNTVDFKDTHWQPVHVYGPLGTTGPWGASPKLQEAPAPRFTAIERPAGPFQFVDGDRVALVGDTFIERSQRDEHLETWLTVLNPSKNILFRNLGWSADTPFGDSRAGFGTAADGFKQLTQQVYDFKPTVILVAYGNAVSLEGTAGMARLEEGYGTLLDMLSVTQARILLVSPTPAETLPAPLPSPEPLNAVRRECGERLRKLAASRDLEYIDLFTPLSSVMSTTSGAGQGGAKTRLTDNGIHLNSVGYLTAGEELAKGLGLDTTGWNLTVDARGRVIAPSNATSVEQERRERFDRVRAKIAAKNLLFFHRWRPQNETYLFGFRKHEQGQNAKEIPMFDPLIANIEAEIAKIRGE
jgi:hypothetical protein